jgi:predicted CoA-binding protein
MGASENTLRYSNMATHMLIDYGFTPLLLGKSGQQVAGYTIFKNVEDLPDVNIHTITLYLNPAHQKPFYSYILNKKPQRLIFNPGTENAELMHLASEAGIACVEACTLVMLRMMLRTRQF